METSTLGFALWLVRQANGLTQTRLAARMKTTRQHISALEVGEKEPTIRTLLRVASALKIDAGCLLVIAEGRQKAFAQMPREHKSQGYSQ